MAFNKTFHLVLLLSQIYFKSSAMEEYGTDLTPKLDSETLQDIKQHMERKKNKVLAKFLKSSAHNFRDNDNDIERARWLWGIADSSDKSNKSQSSRPIKKVEDNTPEIPVYELIEPYQITEKLSDVIVDNNIIKNLNVVIKYFENKKPFEAMGAKCPRGILLEGPAGTGKTSLGRALAKETGANFLYVNGPSIDSKFVGDGAKQIHQLFLDAQKMSPCIIFIDEIDTLAKKRVSEESRFYSQTLQQLLTELDGFKKLNKSVIVIATTNNKDHLDGAILRSGRFDIHLHVANPTIESRKKILERYAKTVKLCPTVNEKLLSHVATITKDFSGSDLENLINQSALEAVMQDAKCIRPTNLNNALKQIRSQKSNFTPKQPEDTQPDNTIENEVNVAEYERSSQCSIM